MRQLVNKEEGFEILGHSFGVAPTSAGFTLGYSTNGTDFTLWDEATPASENLFVCGAPKNVYWKLVGNVDDNVLISY